MATETTTTVIVSMDHQPKQAKLTTRAFTKEEHDRFCKAATELCRLYTAVGEKELAQQWFEVSVQHRKAATKLTR